MQDHDADIASLSPTAPASRKAGKRIVVERDHSTDELSWDRFAALCGASFRAAHRALGAWQFDHHLMHVMRRYAVFLERPSGRVRIGQAAIGFGPTLRVFAEGLQLLPEHRGFWREAMSALLSHCGAGLYHYGSGWSLEPPRENECAAITGVRVVDTQAITMHAIHFSRWSCWDDYFREVSYNARRNVKKAEKLQERLTIESHRGLRMMRNARHLLSLRRGLYARKAVEFSMLSSAARLLLRATVMREHAFIALARIDGAPVSAFGGITFGDNTYFLDSGSIKEDNGAYWFLMMRVIREAYERAPLGHFVTGPYYHDAPVSAGLDFFRYQCEAQGNPTSKFTFDYRPQRSTFPEQ